MFQKLRVVNHTLVVTHIICLRKYLILVDGGLFGDITGRHWLLKQSGELDNFLCSLDRVWLTRIEIRGWVYYL